MTTVIVALAFCGALGLLLFSFGLLRIPVRASRSDSTKAIVDSNPDGIVVTDRQSRIIYANEAYRALSGARSSGELKPVERVFAGPPDISEFVYRLSQASKAGKSASEELRLAPAPNGEAEVAWYRIRVRPLEGVARQGATVWTVSDETREHHRHESFFQDLQHAIDYLDHAPAGFFSADRDGAIVYMNATLAEWLDFDLAQFGLGQLRIDDIIAGDGGAMLTMMSGEPGDVKTQQFDVDLKSREGRVLPARIFHKVAFSSDGAPGPSRSLVINRAPGELKGQENLRAAEVRFARFFNSTPVAIAPVDASGTLLRSNAAFVRLVPEALKSSAGGGKLSIFALVAERDHAPLRQAIAAAAEGRGEIAPLDVSLEAAEATRSARLFVSAADPGSDEGASAIVFALDTTEQRTLQENLAQSQKMQAIGQLAGGVAHDFNNVLTAIIGYSDLLLANHRPTDPSFQDIMQIKQNANRAAGLVRQLLAFSRRQTLRPQTLQLNDVLSELQMLLRRLVGETIHLDVVHSRDLWLVKADVNQFEQVIVNLVVNARDAMPDGGKITLRTRNFPASESARLKEMAVVPADYVLVEVQDTGHGIPADVQAKIFEPFFTTKEVGKGTGLGLSMVYGIVKQTGGYVFCESEPGAGATFRILLPRLVEVGSRGACREGRRQARRGPHRARRHSPGRGRGGGARLRLARARFARLYRARGGKRGRGAPRRRGSRRTDRSHRLRRHHAGNGRADDAGRIAPPRIRREGRLRVRLRRRRLRPKPAGEAGIRLSAEAVHAQAADRDRQGGDAVTRRLNNREPGVERGCVLKAPGPMSQGTN